MTTSASLPAFTKEQYDSILALIQSSKIASPQHMVNQVSTSVSTGHTSVEAYTSGNAYCSLPISHCLACVKSNSWILYSEASDHICSSLNWFTTYYTIEPTNVKLPNNNIVVTNIASTINLTPHLVLHRVLYLKDFSFNLISVSKLCSSSNCILHFFDKYCELQDMTSHKKIGLAYLREGLYKLKLEDSIPRTMCNTPFSQHKNFIIKSKFST